jgi:hypothetical protein
MKGKKAADKPVTKAYAGGDSNVAKASRAGDDGFKRGGKVKKSAGKIQGACVWWPPDVVCCRWFAPQGCGALLRLPGLGEARKRGPCAPVFPWRL